MTYSKEKIERMVNMKEESGIIMHTHEKKIKKLRIELKNWQKRLT
jgi:hypothetical protein